jgi:hypothetical protein
MGVDTVPSEVFLQDAAEPVDCFQEVDVEKNGEQPSNALQGDTSGPPYSIFTSGQKAWIIFLVSVSALISPFGATTFLPALEIMSKVLHITPTQTNISITTYMVRSGSSIVHKPKSDETRSPRQ